MSLWKSTLIALAMIALVVIAVGPGCGGTPDLEDPLVAKIDALRDILYRNVQDPARVEKLDALLDQYETRARKFYDSVRANHLKMLELASRYESTSAEMDQLLQSFRSQRETSIEDTIALSKKALKLMTPEEYAAINKELRDWVKSQREG